MTQQGGSRVELTVLGDKKDVARRYTGEGLEDCSRQGRDGRNGQNEQEEEREVMVMVGGQEGKRRARGLKVLILFWTEGGEILYMNKIYYESIICIVINRSHTVRRWRTRQHPRRPTQQNH